MNPLQIESEWRKNSPAQPPSGAFKRGDRVRYSKAYLETGRKIDARWYAQHKDDIGIVDWIQRDGDVVVLWVSPVLRVQSETMVHPPHRLELLPL